MNPDLKQKLYNFRIAELKNVLDKLSLPTSGRKADLQERVLAYFGDGMRASSGQHTVEPAREQWRIQLAEKVINEVNETFQATRPQYGWYPAEAIERPHRMPASTGRPAGSSAMPSRVEYITPGLTGTVPAVRPPLVNGKPVPPHNYGQQSNGSIRCLCEQTHERGVMVQCEGEGCGVWQHLECLGIMPAHQPDHFFCEACRIAGADPFWEVVNSKILQPTKLIPTGGLPLRGPGGVSEMQQVADKTFTLTTSQLDVIKKPASQLQAVCLMLNDPVPFRFQWPRHADLRMNGMSYRVYNRSSTAKITNNVRDEPASLANTAFGGKNRIRLQVNDSRKFVICLNLVRKRSIEEIKALMAPAESLQAGLERVRKQVGGDEDISMGTTILPLKDPLSGARVKTPVRVRGTNGLASFDLDTFVTMAQRSRRWQCPHSMKHSRVQDFQIDGFILPILQALEGHPEITEVEVSPEGQWRPTNASYPWITVPNPLPAPLPAAVEVKREAAGGNSDSEEDVSEGEELRRAAAAYARSTKAPPPEIIVLDDSSDEEQPPPKRPCLPNQQSSSTPASYNGLQQRVNGALHRVVSRGERPLTSTPSSGQPGQGIRLTIPNSLPGLPTSRPPASHGPTTNASSQTDQPRMTQASHTGWPHSAWKVTSRGLPSGQSSGMVANQWGSSSAPGNGSSSSWRNDSDSLPVRDRARSAAAFSSGPAYRPAASSLAANINHSSAGFAHMSLPQHHGSNGRLPLPIASRPSINTMPTGVPSQTGRHPSGAENQPSPVVFSPTTHEYGAPTPAYTPTGQTSLTDGGGSIAHLHQEPSHLFPPLPSDSPPPPLPNTQPSTYPYRQEQDKWSKASRQGAPRQPSGGVQMPTIAAPNSGIIYLDSD